MSRGLRHRQRDPEGPDLRRPELEALRRIVITLRAPHHERFEPLPPRDQVIRPRHALTGGGPAAHRRPPSCILHLHPQPDGHRGLFRVIMLRTIADPGPPLRARRRRRHERRHARHSVTTTIHRALIYNALSSLCSTLPLYVCVTLQTLAGSPAETDGVPARPSIPGSVVHRPDRVEPTG